MTEIPLLASAYSTFLAATAALLSRTSRQRALEADWPHAELPKFRGGVARTLLVLAGLMLAVTAARHRAEPFSLACLGSAAIVVAYVARRRIR